MVSIVHSSTLHHTCQEALAWSVQSRTRTSNWQKHTRYDRTVISGGLASLFSSRLELANNPQVSQFKASEDVSSIIYIDANNLYEGIILQYPLPLKNFEQVENVTFADIMEVDDEGEIGYILEVDLEYPE